MVGEWRSDSPSIKTYEVYEAEHKISLEYWGGYVRQNRIHRKIFDGNDVQIGDEYITENNAIMMYEPFLSEPVK